MLDEYDSALLDFTGDQLRVFPYRGGLRARDATVQTELRKIDGSLVVVDYKLRRTD
jgi:ABC-type transporter MlaC component